MAAPDHTLSAEEILWLTKISERGSMSLVSDSRIPAHVVTQLSCAKLLRNRSGVLEITPEGLRELSRIAGD